VTPFVAHANAIRDALADVDINTPVRLPDELTGEYHETAVVSLSVSDPKRVVSSPISDIKVLYTALFNSNLISGYRGVEGRSRGIRLCYGGRSPRLR